MTWTAKEAELPWWSRDANLTLDPNAMTLEISLEIFEQHVSCTRKFVISSLMRQYKSFYQKFLGVMWPR